MELGPILRSPDDNLAISSSTDQVLRSGKLQSGNISRMEQNGTDFLGLLEVEQANGEV